MTKKLLILVALTAIASASPLAAAGIKGKALDVTDVQFLSQTVQDGPHPDVLIYGESVVFGIDGLPDGISLSANIDPRGNTAPRVFFLYVKNMATGEIRYIDNTGLLDPGLVRAIDGSGPDTFTMIDVTAAEGLILLGEQGLVGPAVAVADLPTGNYQLVLELREGSGQRTIVFSSFDFVVVDAVMPLQGNITQDTTLTANNAYLINNTAVFVQDGATLTIEPGTVILGTGQNSALVVAQGGFLMAKGTQARPIVMTSAQAVGERGRGDWGGLIINGRSVINTGSQDGEGGTGQFGGNDTEDSSGVLEYVRVEFAGIEFSPDNELNGIAFQGTGSGTIVKNIQVHYNKDDGVEFFGGTTNAKYVLLTGIGDDNLDWVLGWQGKIQFLCAQQDGTDADQGIEADNLEDNTGLMPISNPMVFNATFIGDPSFESVFDPETNEDVLVRPESDIGALLREGTAGYLRNIVIQGFKEMGVDVDTPATVTRINDAGANNLSFENSLFYGNCAASSQPGFDGACDSTTGIGQVSDETDDDGELLPFTTQDWLGAVETNRFSMDPLLRNPHGMVPDWRPALNSPALDVRFVELPPDDGFFTTDIDYIGCVSPTYDWTKGWSNFVPF